MTDAQTQTFEFQAETRQLLDIVIHSLYTEKKIFIRELISNASDALERMRHLQLTEHAVYDAQAPLEIEITTDEATNTLVIRDSGVGMTRDELVKNLGTIAHSGSRGFLEARSEGAETAPALIGQFGVGFYSAFMVAKTVTVHTRSWRIGEAGWEWRSTGVGTYDMVERDDEEQRRGTRIAIELKDECVEFGHEWTVREILEQYSAFVSFPILLNGTRVNAVQALWLQNRSEVSDDEYAEFYRFQARAHDTPKLRLHFSADVPLAINALLFVPARNEEKLGLSRSAPTLALYSRRVLIDAAPKNLLPGWLRFLKGVIDCEDVRLNVSRETLQDNAVVAKLNRVLTVRFLRFLEEEASQRRTSYDGFYEEFGHFLKEGVALDQAHREQLAKLIRYQSSATAPGTTTSFAEYVSRMAADQTDIYYIMGSTRASIEGGPYLEGFRARGIEVLFCDEPVDEYVMHNVRVFDGKKIVAADHADVALPATSGADGADDAIGDEDVKRLTAWLGATLGDRVADVRPSARLTDSPALVVSTDKFTSPHMRRMMKAMSRPEGDAQVRVILEINPRHRIIRRLAESAQTSLEKAALVAEQLLDNALLSAGLLDDTTAMVARLNRLLEHV